MDDHFDLISIIIPVYNTEAYLDQCIQSVINQTYKNIEIILVDDGSEDNSYEKCRAWAQKDSRIKVIRKGHSGVSDSRNLGLKIASGEFIGFIDSDDWIEPNMYEYLHEILVKENAEIAACGIINDYGSYQTVPTVCDFNGPPEEAQRLIYTDTIFPVSSWNKLFARRIWNIIRFPSGKICEDAATTYLLLEQANKVVQTVRPFYHYCIRSNSIMTAEFQISNMDEEEAWRSNYLYMNDHHPEIAQLAYDFYLQKVFATISKIKSEQQLKYIKQYSYLYSIIRSNMNYILFKSKIGLRNRLKLITRFISLTTPSRIRCKSK